MDPITASNVIGIRVSVTRTKRDGSSRELAGDLLPATTKASSIAAYMTDAALDLATRGTLRLSKRGMASHRRMAASALTHGTFAAFTVADGTAFVTITATHATA